MTLTAPLRLVLALLLTGALSPLATLAAQQRSGTAGVLPGIDVLLKDSLHLLRGKRVGLVTNHSGRLADGRSTIDALHSAPGVTLVALYGPEHGLRGVAQAGEKVASSVDSATGVPIHSLYGEVLAPTPEMLNGVEVLVYDIQDVGARVYTFQWTMAHCAAAAGRAGIPFVILDRPNPIRGDRVEGGMLDSAHRSFVGLHEVALRYGFTPGELGRWLAMTGRVKADVRVVPMQGYRRSMWWEETGLTWVNPSPNLRTVEATLLYPGLVFFEGTNLSEGRGTDAPFTQVGAPWMTDARAIAAELNAKGLVGVQFDAALRTVEQGQKHGGLTIPMVRVRVTDRDRVEPTAVGLHLLRAIYARHASDWRWRVSSVDRLFGSPRLRAAVEREGGIEALLPILARESAAFAEDARRAHLYR